MPTGCQVLCWVLTTKEGLSVLALLEWKDWKHVYMNNSRQNAKYSSDTTLQGPPGMGVTREELSKEGAVRLWSEAQESSSCE